MRRLRLNPVTVSELLEYDRAARRRKRKVLTATLLVAAVGVALSLFLWR